MTDPKIVELVEALHPLEKVVLDRFRKKDQMDETELLVGEPLLHPSQLSMSLGWLLSKEILTISGEKTLAFVSLTETGEVYAERKIPPLRMLDVIRQKGQVSIRELQERSDMEAEEKSSAIGALKASGLVRVAAGGLLEIVDEGKAMPFEQLQGLIIDLKGRKEPVLLSEITPSDQELIASHHRKRGKGKGIFRIDERVTRTYVVAPIFTEVWEQLARREIREEYALLTPEMLKSGSWRGQHPRPYNIQLRPARLAPGRKHPYREFLDFVKGKLVAMGFEEMRGPLVESEFWNMDALFMPQFHPAREIHDVYYAKGPLYNEAIDASRIEAVAAVHRGESSPRRDRTGASRGWRYPFDVRRTRRLILRSQGTAVSSRTMARGPSIPGKYFSVARCFRYDQVDATHAPDFFQVEGIVLGEDIHFRTLLGLLVLFAREVAKAEEVKFLPAYFPFTEPSVEMHAKHPELGWMELGGAGLFRPEVIKPLGVSVPVIAWGLGLDRMAMMALGISDIRLLFSGDLELIRQKRIRLS